MHIRFKLSCRRGHLWNRASLAPLRISTVPRAQDAPTEDWQERSAPGAEGIRGASTWPSVDKMSQATSEYVEGNWSLAQMAKSWYQSLDRDCCRR